MLSEDKYLRERGGLASPFKVYYRPALKFKTNILIRSVSHDGYKTCGHMASFRY